MEIISKIQFVSTVKMDYVVMLSSQKISADCKDNFYEVDGTRCPF